ncbi:MAG: hypothetical protein GC134_09150 [Proteobacteria bacterium]|nr:hypothetical protein [Pseudomonadota bacterium]
MTLTSSLRTRMLQNAQSILDVHNCPVRINGRNLLQVAKTITGGDLTDWDFYLPAALRKDSLSPMYKSLDDTLMDVAWFFWAQSSLNYCYWYHDDKGALQHWVYKGKKGSSGLVVLMQELYETTPLFGADTAAIRTYMGNLAASDMWDLPLPDARFDQLNTVFNHVGPATFKRIFAKAKQADGSWHMSADLAKELADAYAPSFTDAGFLKRAQLALGMTGANFIARGQKVTFDLTAYADYRVPQVLRHLGIIGYSAALSDTVDSQQTLHHQSVEELSIRAATIVACARLAKLTGLTDAHIDAWLFIQTRNAAFEADAKPFHLTVTEAY